MMKPMQVDEDYYGGMEAMADDMAVMEAIDDTVDMVVTDAMAVTECMDADMADMVDTEDTEDDMDEVIVLQQHQLTRILRIARTVIGIKIGIISMANHWM